MLVRLPWGLRRTGAHLTWVSPAPNISHQPQGEKNNAAKASLPTPTQGRPGSAQPQMETCMCARNCTERAEREWDRICLLRHLSSLCCHATSDEWFIGRLKRIVQGSCCPLPFLSWGMSTKCPSTRWPSTDILKKVSGLLWLCCIASLGHADEQFPLILENWHFLVHLWGGSQKFSSGKKLPGHLEKTSLPLSSPTATLRWKVSFKVTWMMKDNSAREIQAWIRESRKRNIMVKVMGHVLCTCSSGCPLLSSFWRWFREH